MKLRLKRFVPVVLLAGLMAPVAATLTSCKSSEQTMYERKQSNKGKKVKSNIKVKGTNKANGHTTRSY